MTHTTEFVSCDWGTSWLRLRRVREADGQVVAEAREPEGVKSLFSRTTPGDRIAREKIFSTFFADRLFSFLSRSGPVEGTIRVMLSGMASSSVGWRELPYARTPFSLRGTDTVIQPLEVHLANNLVARIHLISGVATEVDMMRGEETEILGLLSQPRRRLMADDGLVILPGTHSKHVRLKQGAIVSISTFMTGELFDVLLSHSLLRATTHSGNGAVPVGTTEPSFDEPAFREGVRAAESPGFARSLFRVRTRGVLSGVPALKNRSYLSGLLIGAEIMSLKSRQRFLPLLLAAAEPIGVLYEQALEELGLKASCERTTPEEIASAVVEGHRLLLQALP